MGRARPERAGERSTDVRHRRPRPRLRGRTLDRETGSRPVLLRVPFNVRKGRFAANVDTLPLTPASDWDVTADGGIVMTDEGVDEWDVYVLDARDALRGKFDPERLLLRSSSPVDVQLAPDGRRVAITTNSSGAESRVAVRPLSGGAETLNANARGRGDHVGGLSHPGAEGAPIGARLFHVARRRHRGASRRVDAGGLDGRGSGLGLDLSCRVVAGRGSPEARSESNVWARACPEISRGRPGSKDGSCSVHRPMVDI